MAISQSPTDADLYCPDCAGTLAVRHDALECEECGYVPRHGSD
ncbi:hypothetical protein [Natronorubrum aibiense]|nr:hypothetical protein [Natronorubrum aibiense]